LAAPALAFAREGADVLVSYYDEDMPQPKVPYRISPRDWRSLWRRKASG
jgi:hypothetical protein